MNAKSIPYDHTQLMEFRQLFHEQLDDLGIGMVEVCKQVY